MAMAQQRANHCPFPHDIVSGRPRLGVSPLVPSPNPRPLLGLLGVTDQELQDDMRKGHPYEFHMGGGKVFKDYKETGNALMERNMHDLLHDKQTEVVFMPEATVPKMARIFDIKRFEARKQMLQGTSPPEFLAKMLKPGTQGLQVAKGDITEQELMEELHKFYGKAVDKEVVVFQGPELRIPGTDKAIDKRWKRENDVVIINKKTKTVYDIESKTTLTRTTGRKAVEQTEELKKILEEFFPDVFASRDWRFVSMVYCNTIKQPVCSDCSPFTIQGATELAAKLSGLENQLKSQSVVPCHDEFVILVQGITFVVFAQPISTFSTITNDVIAKVEGVPATGKAKAKAGQGDLQSIVFWTNEQAKIMLWDQPFVFFNGPWSTGKTLLMREKAVMVATQNPTEKLFFVVVRYDNVLKTRLLEMELKSFFHEQHNLQNVEVLGLLTTPENTLTSLLKEATTRPPGSWMVDELIMPKDHQQWSKELHQLQNHIEAQTGKPHIWIACAGINEGKTEHFERSYLTSVLPPVFHLPQMDIPLRNTKQTLAMAGLEGNTGVKGLDTDGSSTMTNPIYNIPAQMISGVEGKQFLVNNSTDDDEVASAVEAACKEVLGRTGGAGFPLLFAGVDYSQISIVKRGVERAGATVLIYHRWSNESCCSEAEVEEWLRRRRSGEEKRVLFLDTYVIRGWEASHLLVVNLCGYGLENLVMRAVGYCALIKAADIDYDDSDINSDIDSD